MFEVRCDKCDTALIVDVNATSKEYYKDMDYCVDDLGEITEKTLQKYLIYRCHACGTVKKLTHKEWELLFRKAIAKDVMEVRKREMFKTINPQTIDPDNGLEYCGQCSGYGNDGYCLIDIIKRCTIRK